MKNNSFKVLARILSYTKKYIFSVVFAILIALVATTLTLFAPIIVGKTIDCAIGPHNVDFPQIYRNIIILGAIVLSASLLNWMLAGVVNKISYNTINDIRNDVFSKLGRLPLKYIDGTSKGNIMSTVITDVDSISDGIIQGFTQLFTGVATIIGTIAFMFSINVKIAVVTVCITPLSLFVASWIGKHSHKMFTEQSKIRGELSGLINEAVTNQKAIQAFSYQDASQSRFEEINSRLYTVGLKAQFLSALTNPCTRFVNAVVYAAVGITGALAALSGELTIGLVSTFLTYANQYTKPFNEITGVLTEFQTALAGAERVFGLLDEQEEPDESGKANISECDGNLEINDVFFSYNKNVPLIRNFNLSVMSGERIAIVGPTGCGKTTLINLLMRFYDIDNGKIEVDGTDIMSVTRESLRKCYGMVLQETWLFKGTVRENIIYGNENASEEDVVAAAKLAHAHGFIKNLPDGYDTVISEDDENISQGQKQLLCIARMMLIKPPMLILDEATSSIDTMTEQRIQKAFKTIMNGRTSFIIAHRLSTIKEADIILVMKDGNIIETGTHSELLHKKGFYSELYTSQYKQS